ncbi:MAG: HNH endonuclease [Methylovulum sp.]|uniref:HNH endonuclease n=1 Tax=Methylovulum sp. TaxID=1916980 RepID=UPI002627815B|nr:HNH endonuclease [Methylovulum sp.]MDD2723488.1 HNH endonuclease [Methylovulum sp.]MDD5124530.1 HNH endonuclease [Methylovulum sp.]
MASKFLNSLGDKEYEDLTLKLLSIQNHCCFICIEKIDLKLHTTNIDHITPLANKGRDSEENFAVTHESCNKSKQDADLKIARILFKLKKIQEETLIKENKSASLKQVLRYYNGSKFDFKYSVDGNKLKYSFSDIGDNGIYETEIQTDYLSKEQTCFISLPLEYIFHDELINPRGINSSISKLVKEFEKKNPQLHLSLGRIEENTIKIFDGQHKAVAQILLGTKKLLIRVFLSPDIDRLVETNTNAGSVLSQIAFDKSVMRQLNNTLYYERIKKYQDDHNLKADDFSFSEQKLVEYFKGDNANIKKYIIDSIKHSITEANENKLKDYIDREGKAKEVPISYSAFDKSFLTIFIDSKLLLPSPINFNSDEGLNPRELEISQIITLLNIIAEEIYINKFLPEIGVGKIENKIMAGKDNDITDDHLIAFRMSKEEIMFNWLGYI